MKLKSISIIALLLLTLSGCAAAAEDQVSTPSEKTYEHPKITSSVKADECSLCHPCEVAVINFATKEIHPLVETCPWFTTDNFSVDCDFEEDGGIDLTIHYSPLRFED